MAEYVPTPGPLPGEQFIPSTSDEGCMFLNDWCAHCTRDKALREGVDLDECNDDEKCEIVAASFRGEAVEWRELPDGSVKCIAFVQHGEPIPPQRCPHTAELPLEDAAGVNETSAEAQQARKPRSEVMPDEEQKTVIFIDMADKDEALPEVGAAEKCADSECPGQDGWETGFGLAGGGYGPYTYCPKCERVVDKTCYRDDET